MKSMKMRVNENGNDIESRGADNMINHIDRIFSQILVSHAKITNANTNV